MVTGSFGRIGQTYTIDVRMIDVESRHVFLTASRDYRGPIDGMLNYIEYIANELASKTAHRLKYGSLEIFSHPSGVFVYIDGELKGKTPYELKEISIGDHFIELKKENYLRWEKNIVIESLKLNKLNAELKKFYALSVKSFPKYSKIYINGKYVANTPWAAKLPEGSYKLVIKKSNYLSESKLINLSNDEEIFFNLKNIRVLESITKSREVELEDKKIEKKSGSKKWIWGLGGAVLIGGGVAAIIILNNGNEDSSSDVIGTPPDPPK